MLGLRLASGLGPELAAAPAVAPALAWGRDMGLVTDGPAGRAVLTRRGRLLSNELFARLL